MPAMLRAVIYTRISTDQDGRSTATARQLEDCIKFVEARGWKHTATYEDPDISAFTRKAVRPSFERMKADIAAGRVDVVVAWKLDRLWRRARDFADLDELCETAGARIVTVVDAIDTSTSAGRMVATMMTGMARAESENISIRMRRKHQEIARDGRPHGGPRLFGYTAAREVVPHEAEMIREAARRLLAGESLRSICVDFNARGYRSGEGNPWENNGLGQLIRSPQLAGMRVHRGVTYPARWEAIISLAEHEALRRLFEGRVKGQAPPRTHYLTGLAYCVLCGARLRGSHTSRKDRGYRCGGCGRVARRADPIEEYIRDLIIESIASPEFAGRVARQSAPAEDVAALLSAIRADELALEELAHDRYVSRMLGAAEFASAHAALSARVEANRARLAKLAPSDSGIDFARVAALWPTATTEWRARVAGALIERVTVGQSARGRVPFHAESVTVHWRF